MSDRPRPIFVVCAPRSGSTLLRLILDAHPQIAVPPPAWLYELIQPYLWSYGDLANPDAFRELCEDVLETPTIKRWELGLDADGLAALSAERSFRGVFEALHRCYAERTGKERWGEKTPRNSFWIDEIKADFPDAQIVHIVRDGRDMAIDISDSPQMRPYSLHMGGTYWRHYVEAIRESGARLPETDFYEIRYEDLCANPEAALTRLCEFLGERFHEAMLSHSGTGGAKAWSSDPQHAKTARPITTEYCEMWRRRLPACDAAALEAEFGDLLEAYGYPRNGAEPLPPRLARQILQSDLVTSPENYAFKAWHLERRAERAQRGLWHAEDRPSLMWGTG